MTTEASNQSSQQLLAHLATIATEEQNAATLDIDILSTLELVKKINNEDKKVAFAIEKNIVEIAQAVGCIVNAFNCGGRLIYIGAGTSGRLGILDAAECPPTFNTDSEQVVAIIAGGEKAIYTAVEGAEDNILLAIDDLKKINLNNKDVLVAIAASGRTPYVISAMQYAKQLKATVIGLSCSPKQPVTHLADISICVSVGAEVLTGSTRMKSGSAQKMVLNMLTTASMIRSGKSYRNLMVDVKASNEKLYARSIRIVMQATECNVQQAKAALAKAENSAKLAILLLLTGVDVTEAKTILAQSSGFLRQAIQKLT